MAFGVLPVKFNVIHLNGISVEWVGVIVGFEHVTADGFLYDVVGELLVLDLLLLIGDEDGPEFRGVDEVGHGLFKAFGVLAGLEGVMVAFGRTCAGSSAASGHGDTS